MVEGEMNKDFCRLVSDALRGQDTWEERAKLRVWVSAILGSVCLVVLLGLAVFAKDAYGQEPKKYEPTEIDELFSQAIKLGGFEKFCQSRDEGCQVPGVLIAKIEDENIAGQFTWYSPTFIRITTGYFAPGTLLFNSTVVHEFVHYLQWLRGDLGPSNNSCEKVRDAEIQAYAAGDAYLAQFGIKKDKSMIDFMLATMCLYG
jgi:hypothetical protein